LLSIKTYRKLKEALDSIPESHLDDEITFLDDEEYYFMGFWLLFLTENQSENIPCKRLCSEELEIGRPILKPCYLG
jgi:hypothetical protein